MRCVMDGTHSLAAKYILTVLQSSITYLLTSYLHTHQLDRWEEILITKRSMIGYADK